MTHQAIEWLAAKEVLHGHLDVMIRERHLLHIAREKVSYEAAGGEPVRYSLDDTTAIESEFLQEVNVTPHLVPEDFTMGI